MNDQLLQQFADIEQEHGLPPGYLAMTGQIESGLNPQSHNELSGADGLFQFIPSTAARYGLRYGKDTRDPIKSANAAAAYAEDNANALRAALRRDPTAGELYLAHQQGTAGAISLLTHPNISAGQLVNPRNISANGGDPTAPAFQFVSHWGQPFVALGVARQMPDIPPDQYGTDKDPLMGELRKIGGEQPATAIAASDILPSQYGTDQDPLMQELATLQGSKQEPKQTATKVAGDIPTPAGPSANNVVAQEFEAGKYDSSADPGQIKFNKWMDYVSKHPTDPKSVNFLMAMASLGLGNRPLGLLAGALPLATRYLGPVLQGAGIYAGAEAAGSVGNSLLKLMEMAH